MAKDKNSFLLYKDILSTIEKLPDETAGKLFKIILRYVNDLNPRVDDLLMQVVFEPIKTTLKRDLKKWEKKSVTNSESGRKGGQISGQKRKANALLKEANEANASLSEANEAVSVIVSVSDSVIVKNNIPTANSEKELAKHIPDLEKFLIHCKSVLKENFNDYEFSLKSKYETWVADDWKDGHGKKIKNWKNKINNTIPHLKPLKTNNFKPELALGTHRIANDHSGQL